MNIHNTDNVSYKKFRPHGRISFAVLENNLVVYKALGPFNLELLNALKEIEPDVLQEMKINNGIWGETVIFENSCLAVDEFFLQFRAYIQAMVKRNILPIASAYVISENIEGAALMARKYQQCYQGTGIHFKIFKNEGDAISWVKGFL